MKPVQQTPAQQAAALAAQQQAAAAALARLESKKQPTPQQKSAAIIRARALKELEKERAAESSAAAEAGVDKVDDTIPAQLTVDGVFYHCPLIGEFSSTLSVHRWL